MSGLGRRLPLLAAAPALALALTSCSAIEQGELESQVAAALESEFGDAPEVTCQEDLDAKVDARTECTAVDPDTGEDIPLTITVTSVEGDTAQFEIERAG
ncbi:DUF4333 domain-containing protein [Geodermatophilus ruber]|uniref:DUF4333 domain-containing protein n=1 Tax=Geodermatophilus ruber TaxID=504800 RepID=A0A1I4K8L8_9ACTN|nr:DUF4333 domain-containing protein [Geodermatophilus ruber]SFL75074.1 protein of unknown function [Geodermatophilus ruber]